MKSVKFCIILLLILVSCQAKTDQVEDTQLSVNTVNISDAQVTESVSTPKASLKKIVTNSNKEESDSVSVDSLSLGCYEWANTYLATTAVEDEEGDLFELYTAITLEDYDVNEYKGKIHIYLSGCEEEMFQGTVTALAEHNYVTVFFDQNVDGMEQMFKKGDKLVKFEISYGEYVASWFAPMNDYVDEYTVLSLQR